MTEPRDPSAPEPLQRRSWEAAAPRAIASTGNPGDDAMTRSRDAGLDFDEAHQTGPC